MIDKANFRMILINAKDNKKVGELPIDTRELLNIVVDNTETTTLLRLIKNRLVENSITESDIDIKDLKEFLNRVTFDKVS